VLIAATLIDVILLIHFKATLIGLSKKKSYLD
jgi:hypothetical protein